MYYTTIKRKNNRKDNALPFIFILSIAFFLSMPFSLHAQNEDISLSVKNVTLKDLLVQIEAKTQVRFSYIDNELDSRKDVTINVKEASIESVLNDVLAAKGLGFTKTGNTIAIKPTSGIEAKKKLVSGLITDESGEPVIGVNVIEKGTTNGTVTDINGKFSLSVNPKSVLLVSYIGYNTQEVPVVGKTTIQIRIQENSKALDEVVVVGYSTQKKVNLTGSVEAVKSETLNKRAAGQVSQMLTGLASGVTVIQNGGQPGKDQGSLRIRGYGTFNNVDPLVLVDGIEESLNNVDPNSIESISVLKDAASSAIYGSRAANGVILVTTKRAEEGKFSFSYNGYAGVQNTIALPKNVNAYEHMFYLNEAYHNMGKTPLYSDDYLADYQRKMGTSSLYPNTNWRDEVITESGFRQNHSVSISGGSERLKFMAMYGFYDQNGLVKNTNYQRHTFRTNTDIKLHSKLSANIDVNMIYAKTTQPSMAMNSIFESIVRLPANTVAMNDNGTWGEAWNGALNAVMGINAGGLNTETAPMLTVTGGLTYKPIEDLAIQMSYSPKFSGTFGHTFNKANQMFYADGRPIPLGNSSLTEASLRSFYDMIKGIATYTKKIKEHDFTVMAGYQQEYTSSSWFKASREGYKLPEYEVLDAGDKVNMKNEGSKKAFGLRSFFGRVNYGFKDRYLFEANLRYDGSSRFAKNNRYAAFPSFSAGWRISEENFMKGLTNVVSNMKLRLSYGELGNQAIDDYYPTVSLLDLTKGYVFDSSYATGATLGMYANKTISWERTSMTNIGLDLLLFSKLNVTADWYYKRTDGILMRLDIPLTMGYSAPYQNVGVVENKGWDITLNYRDRVGEVNYNVIFNLADVKNKVLDMKNVNQSGQVVNREGYPMNSLNGYESAGLFTSEQEIKDHAKQFGDVKPGDIKYVDQNNDNVIDAKDEKIIGNTIPRFTYSLNLNLEYKNFDLNMLFQGVGKCDGYINNFGIYPFWNSGTIQYEHLDRWTAENPNPNATFPRFTIGHPNNEKTSDFWVKDASYLRMKNLQIGYSLPKTLLSKIGLQRLRFFLTGENLFTVTSFWKAYDPEAPLGMGNFYPQTKTYSAGVEIKF